LRAERDNDAVTRHLGELKAAAADPDSGVNLLYPMHDALRARATVGEVCNALRDVWGIYQPKDAL
jgi:methylmalonyl-CoA mutase, N-terminal domain